MCILLVGWSLTSHFSTNTAISHTNVKTVKQPLIKHILNLYIFVQWQHRPIWNSPHSWVLTVQVKKWVHLLIKRQTLIYRIKCSNEQKKVTSAVSVKSFIGWHENYIKLECGSMPNVMAALTNIVAPSVQRHKVWLTLTTRVPCNNAPNTRNPLIRALVAKI